MIKAIGWLILVAVLGGFIVFLFWPEQEPRQPEVAQTPAVPAPPPIRHPIEAAREAVRPTDEPPLAIAKPLPELADSDGAMRDVFAGLFGKDLERYFYLDRIIQRIVATVDNLPREIAPLQLMPVKPVSGWLATTGKGETLALSPKNAARYRLYIRLAESAATGRLVATYVRFYSLFQEQYERLGYPGKYFNDRLMDVIDDLLAAPETAGPVLLTQNNVIYQFADPSLERLSAGQKIMIRMGSENAAKVKAKLREFRNSFAPKATKG